MVELETDKVNILTYNTSADIINDTPTKQSTNFNIGVSKENIPSFIIDAVTTGQHVGHQGNGPSPRDVFKTKVDGHDAYIAVTISNNGYIVGANVTKPGKFKED